MRLEEHCPCGGSIVVNYDISGKYTRPPEHAEGRDQLDKWRRAHRPCLKTRQEKPEPKPGS